MPVLRRQEMALEGGVTVTGGTTEVAEKVREDWRLRSFRPRVRAGVRAAWRVWREH